MNTEAAFLASIIANPADNTQRLIYADWLMDRGDPRGEFIRVQVDLTSRAGCKRCRSATVARRIYNRLTSAPLLAEAWCLKCDAHFRRELELLPLLSREGFGLVFQPYHLSVDPVQPDGLNEPFGHIRRGFVESVALPCADFFHQAGALFQAAPIREVQLRDREAVSMPGAHPHCFWWFTPEFWLPNQFGHWLPMELFPHFEGEDERWPELSDGQAAVSYRSGQDALDALSAPACCMGVKWLRSRWLWRPPMNAEAGFLAAILAEPGDAQESSSMAG